MKPNIQKIENRNSVRHVSSEVQYYGPLPPAAEFLRYNEVLPGAGDRLLKNVENQIANRIKNEQKLIDSQVFCEKAGLIMGFLVTLGSLGVSGFCAYKGFPISASIIGAGGIAALAGVFVVGSKKKPPK